MAPHSSGAVRILADPFLPASNQTNSFRSCLASNHCFARSPETDNPADCTRSCLSARTWQEDFWRTDTPSFSCFRCVESPSVLSSNGQPPCRSTHSNQLNPNPSSKVSNRFPLVGSPRFALGEIGSGQCGHWANATGISRPLRLAGGKEGNEAGMKCANFVEHFHGGHENRVGKAHVQSLDRLHEHFGGLQKLLRRSQRGDEASQSCLGERAGTEKEFTSGMGASSCLGKRSQGKRGEPHHFLRFRCRHF